MTYIFILMKNVYPEPVNIEKLNISEDTNARDYFLNNGQTVLDSEESKNELEE